MVLASTVKVVLGLIAFAIFWALAVFPAVPFLPVARIAGSLLGGILMVIFQVITTDQAYAAIDLQGEGSRSRANQARDGEGKGSSSGESQGQDRGEGSASGEYHGGDRNAEGSRSSDDEDERERERQRGFRGDIEQGRQESNEEEIDFSTIPETFMTIIGAVTIAVIDFHSNGAISSTVLRLVIAINVFGFLCCLTSMLHRHRKPKAARIFGTIGVAAASLALLLLASIYFSNYYGLIILGLGSLAILVICVWAFRP